MNENIVNFINTEAIAQNAAIMVRRFQVKNEDRQRMKIISEIIELYDSYYMIGCEQITDAILEHMKAKRFDEACTLYQANLAHTRMAELADVVISTLTLKHLLEETVYTPVRQVRPAGTTFIALIGDVADSMPTDSIISWAISFANTHGISLAEQIKIKLMYNDRRTDWTQSGS
jgi:hypothetical protein